MTDIIRVQDAWYEYERADDEGELAVRGVSLSVRKGEWLSIIGRNGSGKSTLIKLLNGLFLPTRGSVTVGSYDTRDEDHIWDVRQRVGMIFQNPDNQIVATIVEEDVAFGLENLGVTPQEIRERVDAALRAVGMQEYAASAPHMLSGGQKQRVAIAGALAMEPEVLLMDEPTAMLDPGGRREVMETVERLHRESGLTVVLVTHFMDEALRGDRVIAMQDGKAILEGAPREVFAREAEALKAAGLEVPAMAELASRLRARGLDVQGAPMTVPEMAQALIARYRERGTSGNAG